MSALSKTPRRMRGWMDLKVVAIKQETPDCITASLQSPESQDCPFDYIPGQYLTFRFDNLADKPVVRSYTMSSSPRNSESVEVTVKQIPDGLVSGYFCHQLKEGDCLRARGPIGRFVWDHSKDHPTLVMVAAGSGVTPFLSIVREYIDGTQQVPQQMALLVSFRTRQDIIDAEELLRWAEHERFELCIQLTREQCSEHGYGRIDGAVLDTFLSKYTCGPATYMTCGPEALMTSVVDYLQQAQVNPEDIKQEAF
ncbi:MAG: FAD-binding oxidoreductase [Zetaproteobacteria bacterium]|nr:FAD-binding oxidoreductase [Zetaproteobacteria bacterium]